MLSLFRKKRPVEANTGQDHIAHNIVSKCLRLQQRWADAMQQRSERLSVNSKRVIFTIFCLTACSLSIYLIVGGLTGHRLVPLSVSRVQVPAHSIQSGDRHTRAARVITKQEYERITGYRRYIDSLARSPTSRPTYDSMLSRYPDLLDSLSFIESIYLSQPKN